MMKTLAVGATLAASLLLVPTPALAASGGYSSASSQATAYFDDSIDRLGVCSASQYDQVGARAIISIQQADGSWLSRSPLDSYANCVTASREVHREAARLELKVCDLTWAGQQYNCRARILDGS